MPWMILPYRRFFDFAGRSCRREYWLFAVFLLLVHAAIFAALGQTVTITGPGSLFTSSSLIGPGETVAALFGLFSLIPWLAVTVRRLHDSDRSGWLLLLWFIPLLGWFAIFVQLCLAGTNGPNRYGPDPRS